MVKGTVLACDSSSRTTSVALLREGALLGEWTEATPAGSSRRLMGVIADLLGRHQVRPSQVNLFVVSRGPGSFTGVRVAMAAMKGLAMATSRPISVVSSLQALAFPLARRGALVVSAIDARNMEVYGAAWAGDRVVVSEGLFKAASLAETVAEVWKEGEVIGVGDGLIACLDTFARVLGPRLVVAGPSFHVIRASVLAEIGASLAPVPASEAVPTYLRRSAAEERALRKEA